jgi:hypothetical protein
MKLAQLRAESKTVLVPFQAGDLKVDYRPNTFTADAVDKINAAMQDPKKQTDAMFDMIGGMLLGWDLEDDDGTVIPLDDAARLRAEVPMQVFGRIFTALQEDQAPGEAATRS